MIIKVELAQRPRLLAAEPGESLGGFPITQTVPGGAQATIEVPDGMTDAEIEQWARSLENQGLLANDGELWRHEHADYAPLWLPATVRPFANEKPGDTFPMIGVTDATQRRGHWGAGVAILHMDTGCDRNHQAFAGKHLARADADAHSHGTHTASTCASAWGVAPDATLYAANVLPGGQGTESGIAAGIRQAVDWAVSQRVPAVLTMSLGGSASSVMDDACRYAQQRGVVVVSAAGNTALAPIGSPARASDVIVMACDRNRTLAPFTSGTNWSNPNRVVAPGVDIAAAQTGTANGVLVVSGTSMATPMVSGIVALLLAAGVSAREAVQEVTA